MTQRARALLADEMTHRDTIYPSAAVAEAVIERLLAMRMVRVRAADGRH